MCGDNENVTKVFPEWFLGAPAKLQKRLLASLMSVHPSAWNMLTSTGWIFHEIWYLSTF